MRRWPTDAPARQPAPRRRRRRLGALGACTCLLLAVPASAASALSLAAAGILPFEGAPFTGTVGTLTDTVAVSCPDPKTYTVTVKWADGSMAMADVGQLTQGSGLTCTYPVSLSAGHSFADEGTESFHLEATGGVAGILAKASADGTATIGDAVITVAGAQLSATVDAPLSATVASLTDANPAATPADYTAVIDWGDGTPASSATISSDAAGGFAVSASHAYQRAGSFATLLTLSDDGGNAASAAGGVTVGARPTPPAPSPPAPAPAPEAPEPPLVAISAPRPLSTSMLALRLACPKTASRCRGVARVITLPSHAQKSPLQGGTSLGRTLFILAPGETRTVPIPITQRLRATLRHAHAARLVGVAITFGPNGRSLAATGPVANIRTTALR